jgi:tRNA (Thr-GGU) A37 N-methylase
VPNDLASERSQVRARQPHPVGLHEVKVVAIEDTRIKVCNLEALDGTAVLDIKPVPGPVSER